MVDNWIDIVILTIVTVSIALGMWRGLFSAILGILSIVVGVYTATTFSDSFTVSLYPILGRSAIVPLAANVMLFFIGFILFSTLSFILRKFLRKIDVGNFDMLGGGVFGLFRAVLFSALIVLTLGTIIPKTQAWKSSHAVPYVGTMIKIAMHMPLLNNYQHILTYDTDDRPAIKTADAGKPQLTRQQQKILEEANQQIQLRNSEEVSQQIQLRDDEIDDVTQTLIEQTAPGQGKKHITKDALKAYEARKKKSPAQDIFHWVEKLICEMQEKTTCDYKRK